MLRKTMWIPSLATALAVAMLAACPALAAEGDLPSTTYQDHSVPIDRARLDKATQMVAKGTAWLARQQEDDGGWSLGDNAFEPAITAIVLKALVEAPEMGPDHPAVKKGYQRLLSYRQDNGGIYDPKQGVQNYTTATAVMALVAAGQKEYQPVIDKAVKYLKGLQIAPGSESPDGSVIQDTDHPFVGGVSYGKHGRPDMSNLGMWMEALHDAGVDGNDPAMQRALVFVTRTQNLSETNPRPWAKISANDGGFIYAPAIRSDLKAGESKAGTVPGGRGLRSYGSMTYVGFKSLLYSDLPRDDQRVQAAYDWIRKHWTLERNPNMPHKVSQQGLYYYYHAFAKALRAWGEPVIQAPKGKTHNWREDLIDALAERVKDDGHFQGNPRWFEDQPVLATSYSMMALHEALAKPKAPYKADEEADEKK